ncbi:MAG: branched-chain amino acid transport system II carrier protein, partial [Winogradskyella sp.]|nr:branched-chain amino acid transport system II carrier protein [Winogradskyella sp.]
MTKTKQTFIFGFALFAGFFGAGNLILPPMLGFNAG